MFGQNTNFGGGGPGGMNLNFNSGFENQFANMQNPNSGAGGGAGGFLAPTPAVPINTNIGPGGPGGGGGGGGFNNSNSKSGGGQGGNQQGTAGGTGAVTQNYSQRTIFSLPIYQVLQAVYNSNSTNSNSNSDAQGGQDSTVGGGSNNNPITVYGRPVHMVCICGLIVNKRYDNGNNNNNMQNQNLGPDGQKMASIVNPNGSGGGGGDSNLLQMQLDDGTGRIWVRKYLDFPKDYADANSLEIGDYINVSGVVRCRGSSNLEAPRSSDWKGNHTSKVIWLSAYMLNRLQNADDIIHNHILSIEMYKKIQKEDAANRQDAGGGGGNGIGGNQVNQNQFQNNSNNMNQIQNNNNNSNTMNVNNMVQPGPLGVSGASIMGMGMNQNQNNNNPTTTNIQASSLKDIVIDIFKKHSGDPSTGANIVSIKRDKAAQLVLEKQFNSDSSKMIEVLSEINNLVDEGLITACETDDDLMLVG